VNIETVDADMCFEVSRLLGLKSAAQRSSFCGCPFTPIWKTRTTCFFQKRRVISSGRHWKRRKTLAIRDEITLGNSLVFPWQMWASSTRSKNLLPWHNLHELMPSAKLVVVMQMYGKLSYVPQESGEGMSEQ
jgi:hypothetical protein